MKNSHKQEWLKLIEEWLKSGMSAKAWCRKNQLVYTTFLGWHYRYKKSRNAISSPQEESSTSSQFIELKTKNESQVLSGVFVECEGVLIHLSDDFNSSTFRKCLDTLRGQQC